MNRMSTRKSLRTVDMRYKEGIYMVRRCGQEMSMNVSINDGRRDSYEPLTFLVLTN